MKTSTIRTLLLLAGALITLNAFALSDLIWERSYDLRSGGYLKNISYITEDGYLLLSGVISQYDGDEGYNDQAFPVVMRLGGNGEPIWINEGSATKYADAPLIVHCDDGGYLVVGATKETEEQVPWIVTARKLSLETGEVVWEQIYPTDTLTSMRAVSAWNIDDGRMLIFGWTHPAQYWIEPTNDKVFVMEIMAETGELIGTTYIDGTERVTLTHVQRIYDGGFILVGKSGEPEPRCGGRAFAMRLSIDLEPIWSQEFEGDGDDNVTALAPYVDGFYLLCSNYDAQLEMEQSYLLNIDLDGMVYWRRSLGGEWRTSGRAMALNREGNLWVGGICIPEGEVGPDKAWLAGVSSEGDLLWQENISGANWGCIFGLAETRNGGVIVARGGLIVMNYSPYANSVSNSETSNPSKGLLISAVSPNPFNSTTTISVSLGEVGSQPVKLGIFDLSGREVATLTEDLSGVNSHQLLSQRTLVWNAAAMPAGNYIVRLQSGNETVARKVMLVR